jgi:hypothetical protein
MKIRRYHVIRPLAVATALIGIAAPAQAGRHDAALEPSAIERLLLQEQARGVDICGGLPACVAGFGGSVPVPSVTIVEPSAFDWGDAGVGAAGAFGLMLLASGLVIVSRHSHRGWPSSNQT